MNDWKVKNNLFVVAILAGIFLFVSSCENEPEPMDLPPAESLILDLSEFPSVDSVSKSVPALRTNWQHSSLTVLGWNTLLAINVAIPVAAYDEASNHTPVYLENGDWEWSYNAEIKDKNYQVRLIGSPVDDQYFRMTMYLSEGNSFTNFEWFTGIIMYDHSSAEWKLNHSPDNPVAYMQVNYEKDQENEEAKIRYTVIDPGNQFVNSYIEYGKQPLLEYDAYYTVSKKGNLTIIQWNTITRAGRVLDEGYFHDIQWRCWDSQLNDVPCPTENNQLSEEVI
ncbi:MAG: hypothetical protein K9J30_09690 [Bacteroidales bacterium]|nr:hypothetical protein [Bacteroidales bacterium]